MHFRKNGIDKSEFGFTCGGHSLDMVDKYKYLGIIMSDVLSYDENAKSLAESAGRALGSIIAKYKMQGYMGYDTQLS